MAIDIKNLRAASLRFVPVASLLLLSACNGGAAPIDSKAFLDDMDGPAVKTVADTMKESAAYAEKQGNFRAAAQTYEQLLEKSPGDATLMLSLADSLRRDGQSARAIAVYDAVLAKDEANLDAMEGKGLALIATGDFDTPADIFDQVLAADQKRWKTLNALGILFTTRNMQPEAQQYFTEALKYHPGSPSIMNNLGLSQALEKNFDGAIATLDKASAIALPGTLERKRIDLNAALVHASSGDVEEAKLLASQYLTGAELNNNLGLYAHLAKDDQLAKAFLNKALSDSKVHYAKAWENLEQLNKAAPQTPAKKPAPAKKQAAAKPPTPKPAPVDVSSAAPKPQAAAPVASPSAAATNAAAAAAVLAPAAPAEPIANVPTAEPVNIPDPQAAPPAPPAPSLPSIPSPEVAPPAPPAPAAP